MILLYSDLHLDQWKAFSTILPSGLNSRLVEQINVINQIKHVAQYYNVTAIIFLGDLFNAIHETISKVVYNTAFYVVRSLAEVAPEYLIAGNHDVYGKMHLFTPFEEIPNVFIVKNTLTETLEGHEFTMCPCYSEIPKSGEILLAHFGLKGAVVGDSYRRIAEEEVDPDTLKNYKLVLCGHYHTRQQIRPNAFQIGSIMANAFSDSNEERGVTLLDGLNMTFVPLTSPKFIKKEINDVEDFPLKDTYNYYKLTLKREDIEVPKELENIHHIIDYDTAPIENRSDLKIEDPLVLLDSVLEFIDKTKTPLDKTEIKKEVTALLNG